MDICTHYFNCRITNLKYWARSEQIISKTLQLLSDLSVGYSSVRKLVKLEAVQFMLNNHTVSSAYVSCHEFSLIIVWQWWWYFCIITKKTIDLFFFRNILNFQEVFKGRQLDLLSIDSKLVCFYENSNYKQFNRCILFKIKRDIQLFISH